MKNQTIIKSRKSSVRKEYFSPRVECILVKLEQGIAAESTELRIGNGPTDVEVVDWEQGSELYDSIPW